MLLRALVDESDVIKAKVDELDEEKRARMFPQSTSSEWFARRIKNQRIKNRTVSIASPDLFKVAEELSQGPETWRASRGTEYKPEIV